MVAETHRVTLGRGGQARKNGVVFGVFWGEGQMIQISLNSTDGNLDSNSMYITFVYTVYIYKRYLGGLWGKGQGTLWLYVWISRGFCFGSGEEVPLRTFAVGSLALSFPATWFTDSSLTLRQTWIMSQNPGRPFFVEWSTTWWCRDYWNRPLLCFILWNQKALLTLMSHVFAPRIDFQVKTCVFVSLGHDLGINSRCKSRIGNFVGDSRLSPDFGSDGSCLSKFTCFLQGISFVSSAEAFLGLTVC